MLTFKTDVEANQFNTFVANSPYSYYMKTSYWGAYKAKHENYQYYLCGLFDNEVLVGTAMVLSNVDKLRGKYLYIPVGMCVNYEDEKLTSAFLSFLKDFAKHQKATFLRIDPNVLRYQNTIDGEPLKELDNHEYVTEYFIKNGFKHRGYGYAYDGSWHNRYTLVIDLHESFDEIIKKFPRTTKNLLKKRDKLGITTRLGTNEEIKYMEKFAIDLSKIQHFVPQNTQFFTDLINDNNGIFQLFITEIDMDIAISNQEADINSNKFKKDPEAQKNAIIQLAKYQEQKSKYGSKIIINASIYAHLNDKVWNVYNYNHKEFTSFKPTSQDHYFTIKYYQDMGVTLYDLVGFAGTTDKNDLYYGLYAYKSSLNAIWIENIGEFDYILKPLLFNSVKLLGKIKKKVRQLIRKK